MLAVNIVAVIVVFTKNVICWIKKIFLLLDDFWKEEESVDLNSQLHTSRLPFPFVLLIFLNGCI